VTIPPLPTPAHNAATAIAHHAQGRAAVLARLIEARRTT
jgi:hypothetical protein